MIRDERGSGRRGNVVKGLEGLEKRLEFGWTGGAGEGFQKGNQEEMTDRKMMRGFLVGVLSL